MSNPNTLIPAVDPRTPGSLPAAEDGVMEVSVDAFVIEDADVVRYLDRLRLRYATLANVDRPAAVSDIVNVDLEISVDGVVVPGGQVSGLSHRVGDGHLLEGLDEALVGVSAGHTLDIRTRVVGGELAGAEARLTVVVNFVAEHLLPPLDASFAMRVGAFGSVEELAEGTRSHLALQRRYAQLYAARRRIVERMVVASGITAPDSLIRDEADKARRSLVAEVQRHGMSFEDYLDALCTTQADEERRLLEAATERVTMHVVLDAFAEQEGVVVSDREIHSAVNYLAHRADVDPVAYLDTVDHGSMARHIRRGKALGAIMDRVVVRDTAGAVVTFDDLKGGEPYARP